MKKSDEASQPNSCWNRATDNELVFVLRGVDAASPDTIRWWASERIRLGKNRDTDQQITSALALAAAMETERTQS